MSLFGSREDDPLLQGDPFAPPPDEDTDEDPKQLDALEEKSMPDGSLNGNSVFDETEERRVVRTEEQAAEGLFDELNASLNHDWRLSRVEVLGAASPPLLVFVLRRSNHEE